MTEDKKSKITLILKDSEHADVGLVLDSLGSVSDVVSDDWEAIGTWQRLKCGIVVELTTTIEARQDILINLLKELSVPRYENTTPVLPLHKRESKIKDYSVKDYSATSRPVEDQFTNKYDDLRKRLSGLQ